MRRITTRARAAILSLCTFGAALPPTALASPPAKEPGFEAAAARAATAQTVHFTYEVEQRGTVEADFDEFVARVASTLEDRRGWTRAGVTFELVERGGDFSLILASPEEVDAAHEICSAQWSCRVADQVLINDERWRTATQAWTGTVTAYRDYLTIHEVGHWLGLGHRDCPGAGAPAPVMQQQSIDSQGCEPNRWPLEWEVEAVADIHGTTPEDPDRSPQVGLPAVVRDRAVWR